LRACGQARRNRRQAAALQPDRSYGMETYDPHKNTTEARQGNRRMMPLRVLVFSGIGVVVVLAIIYIIYAMGTPPTAQ
jgi:hypothetical protein